MLKRGFYFIIILIISLIIIPNDGFALSTEYININDQNIIINDSDSGVQFSQVSFKNWSAHEFPTIGLGGIVYNRNNYDISFMSVATFYDSNYNIVATTYSSQYVPANEYNSYSQLSSINEINSGYTAHDIAYYKLDVQITKKETTTTNNNLESSNYDYVLNSYDININVNENNTLEITEKIGAYFNIDKHGIFRKIPLKNEVVRLDGTTSKNRAKLSDISVSENYTVSTENGYKVIKIGDANYTLRGEKNYTISYLYNLGKDPSKAYDELYFNLIGEEWDTSISNITFMITMPKAFDASKLGFSAGTIGSTDSSNITYEVNGNVITGKYNGTLSPGEALTVRLELEEGYFVNAGIPIDIITYLLLIPIVFLIISLLLWYKYGKDKTVVETVEFYPPKDFNSLEVGFLYNGKATSKDVVSLLIYLANKGYIKITEIEEQSLFSKKKSFKITKLREYDGSNEIEEIFLKGLFEKKNSKHDIIENNLEVSEDDLYNKFYTVMKTILQKVNDKENKHKIFEKSTLKKSLAIVLMLIISLIIISIKYLEVLPFVFYGFYLCIIPTFKNVDGDDTFYQCAICFAILIALFFVTALIIMILEVEKNAIPLELIYTIICIGGMLWCLAHMPKRTLYGNEMLGKLKGFKRFLQTAKKEQLESMVMENPTYFYDILPFTYVLGVSDKWISKFETITLHAPNWYDSPSEFSTTSFGVFMNNTMKSAQSSMSSSPSSGSSTSGYRGGGGSSGGGSSGGGSGGGGGGSW